MKNHLEKENVEFRYYEMPQGMPVLPLLGENGLHAMEQIPCIFTIIWNLDIVIREKVSCILAMNLYHIGREPLL